MHKVKGQAVEFEKGVGEYMNFDLIWKLCDETRYERTRGFEAEIERKSEKIGRRTDAKDRKEKGGLHN